MENNSLTLQKPRKSGYDALETLEARKQAIGQAVSIQSGLLARNIRKFDLSDTEKLKEVAQEYTMKCAEAGLVPNVEGLCSALGIGRRTIYDFLESNPGSTTTKYLDALRTSWASIRMQLAETKVLDPASTIFILKNSSLGFADRIDIAPAKAESPLSVLDSDSARKRILEGIPDDDDGTEEY